MASSRYGYGYTQRLLHWLIALMVIMLLAIGALMGTLDYEGIEQMLGAEMAGMIYQYHKTFGILLLILMIPRILLKRKSGEPPYDPPMPGVQHAASLGVHVLFYLTLLAMPIVGWLGTAAGGFPVQFFDWTLPGFIGKDEGLKALFFDLHEWIGWAIFGLLILHVAGAIYHWKIKRDNIMERMGLF